MSISSMPIRSACSTSATIATFEASVSRWNIDSAPNIAPTHTP